MPRSRSDNGTNFTGAEKELTRAIAELNNWTMKKTLLRDNIKWGFNPPLRWCLGKHDQTCWKGTVLSVLHLQTLTDEALRTVLCEAEAIPSPKVF